jgi:Type II secretory pathway, ATPase PulE/Tfp pilus assembly pathway, ATPase PilB
VNVCTIEDPIEMVDVRVNQMQVQPEIDLTFAAACARSCARTRTSS